MRPGLDPSYHPTTSGRVRAIPVLVTTRPGGRTAAAGRMPGVITVGLDVASQARDTAACRVEWKHGEATIRGIEEGVGDCAIRDIVAGQAEKCGVDVPLGWPDAFVQALGRHHRGEPWGEHVPRALTLRATDHAVRELAGTTPLSVSTDRIAYPAMRMARLLAGVDRSGDGRVVEVYPAAALRVWGLTARGYKGADGVASLADLVASLRDQAPWLHGDEEHWRCVERNDDAFDALIASLVARAHVAGLCHPIPPEHRAAAAVEGWIAVPLPGSLPRLAERIRLHHDRVGGGPTGVS